VNDPTPRRGDLFILSAPSGTGKTTLIRGLLEGPMHGCAELAFSVSHTTRAPRTGEVDGQDYYFVDSATFQSMVAADLFLEWAEVHGNFYGTALAEVMPRLDQGMDVLLDIDVQGAARVVARHPTAYSIFVMPPSYQVLARRLARRGLDDPQSITRRLATSAVEMERWNRYNYVIINDDAARASEALASIIREKRYRQDSMRSRVQSILKDFQERGDPQTL
jgi:guanylate kinase